MRAAVVLLWSLVAVVVLSAAGVVGFLTVLQDNPDVVAQPEEETPIEADLDTSYDIGILNGTATAGLVETVQSEIVAAGWPEDLVSGGDSDTTDFPQTTVYYAAEEHAAAAAGLAEVLGGARIELDDAYASSPEAKELWVVLGLDSVSTG